MQIFESEFTNFLAFQIDENITPHIPLTDQDIDRLMQIILDFKRAKGLR